MTADRDRGFIDPALWRGMTQRRMSRRELLRSAGAGAGALGLGAVLAACGTGPSNGGTTGDSPAGATGEGSEQWWSEQTLRNEFNFANWPYYIDVSHGDHPSLDQFTKDTGIKVNYFEVIQDYPEFFQKIKPVFDAGEPLDYDLFIYGSGYDPRWSTVLDWVIPLDQSKMTNFYKYSSNLVKNPTWDPGNKYSMAWQSGYTAIAYNAKYIDEEITSLQSLFDPKYKGKVGMMSDPSELGSQALVSIGVEPAASTPADWQEAADKLTLQKDAGIVRSYYGQSYVQALKNEDTWISMCWSGDIFQANLSGFTDLKMVIPEEGAMFWTDSMLIPKGVANPVDAMTYMDYVYQPEVQAVIEAYNNYVCPVPAAQDILATKLNAPEVANSPTVFPTEEMQTLSRAYYQFTSNEELLQWNNLFLPVIQG
jgi:spermidine/putrescine transport system substrate-binding protein